ncbi:MAG: hypothetical protein LBU03_00335 [Tannerellaceae bacterium]|nr:hypothetical protein [Tannerellaceae bacterium]
MTKTTIPVFFSFNRNYCLPATVAIHSMLKYASKDYHYDLSILHTDLREKDQQELFKAIHHYTITPPHIELY